MADALALVLDRGARLLGGTYRRCWHVWSALGHSRPSRSRLTLELVRSCPIPLALVLDRGVNLAHIAA